MLSGQHFQQWDFTAFYYNELDIFKPLFVQELSEGISASINWWPRRLVLTAGCPPNLHLSLPTPLPCLPSESPRTRLQSLKRQGGFSLPYTQGTDKGLSPDRWDWGKWANVFQETYFSLIKKKERKKRKIRKEKLPLLPIKQVTQGCYAQCCTRTLGAVGNHAPLRKAETKGQDAEGPPR